MSPSTDVAHLVVYLITGFAVAAGCTPVGISGAFLLVPFQVSVLGLNSVSVSSTGLVFNILSAPAGIVRYWRDGRIDARLARLVLTGSVPAIVLGAWLRVHLLSDPRSFKAIAGIVLVALAIRVIVGGRATARNPGPAVKSTASVSSVRIAALAALVGFAGGMYGIGGGSLLAPLLVASGIAVTEVAGAALVATFGSSLAGLLAYLVFGSGSANATPFWTLGLCFGLGGLAGSYVGARAQRWLPEAFLTWLIAALAGLTGLLYLYQAVTN